MAHTVVTLRDEQGVEHAVTVGTGGSLTAGSRTMRVFHARRGEVRVDERTVWVASDGSLRWIFIDGRVHIFEVIGAGLPATANPFATRPHTGGKRRRDGALSAPMPATVVKIVATPGDQVKAGDLLLVLEAMKMELPVRAAVDGTVRSVRCRQGELVQPGEELVELEAPTGS
jgi:biotin carboxyl carrier protein